MVNAPDKRNLRDVVLRLNFDDRSGRHSGQSEVLTKPVGFRRFGQNRAARLNFLLYGLRRLESMMFINFPRETLQ